MIALVAVAMALVVSHLVWLVDGIHYVLDVPNGTVGHPV